MADNYTFLAQGNVGYVPTLHKELLVEFSLKPEKFCFNKYVQRVMVDKMVGYYVKMKNDSQMRFINIDDFRWADGGKRPEVTYGNESAEYKQWNAQRNAVIRRFGDLFVKQCAWDAIGQGINSGAQELCTARAVNIATTLTTPANLPSGNTINASSYGSTWANSTSSAPAIRKSIMAAMNLIVANTGGAVQISDLCVVMNNVTASQQVAVSNEWIDFIKQSPDSLRIWEGQEQYQRFNIPSMLFGAEAIVDWNIYCNTVPDPNGTPTYVNTFPTNYAVVMPKPNALKSTVGQAYGGFMLFVYEDMATFSYYDQKHRIHEVQITDIVDFSANSLVAPQTIVIINTNS